MSIVKRNTEMNPFYTSLLDEFFNGNLVPAEGHKQLPAMNIIEEDKQLRMELRVPGFKKDDFKLSYDNGILTLSCEKSNETEEKKEGKYLRREFSSYSFRRSVELPEERYDVSKAEATYKDGILEVTMPKKEHKDKLSKTIEVK
ncbi:MAG: Hsp20/alpha crystallin family protein [Marinifilaceae bacterium]